MTHRLDAVPLFLLWACAAAFTFLFVVLLFYEIKKVLNPNPIHVMDGARLVPASKLAKQTKTTVNGTDDVPLILGTVPIPRDLQDRHFLLVGTTGAGKSVAIRQLLPVIRARHARAIIIDLGGEFVRQFRQPGDKVFCPGSAGTILWNPLAEIKTEQDIDLVLSALVPRGATPDEETWRGYARNFLKALMLRLQETNELSLERLRYYLSCGDKEQAAFLQEGDNPYKVNATSMTGTVKDMLSNMMLGLRAASETPNFSVRDWVRSGTGFLFITPDNSQRAALSTLINTLMNLAVAEALSARNDARYAPLFVVVDELAAFDFDDLPGVLERGRKYGLTAVAGIQNVAQLRQKYGKDGAITLMACFRIKLILNPGDSETAEFMAREIGRQIIERKETSTSRADGRTNVTSSFRREERWAVMPETLMRLRDRDGYLKLVGDYPVAKIRIPLS